MGCRLQPIGRKQLKKELPRLQTNQSLKKFMFWIYFSKKLFKDIQGGFIKQDVKFKKIHRHDITVSCIEKGNTAGKGAKKIFWLSTFEL